jgi:hypothetical protein
MLRFGHLLQQIFRASFFFFNNLKQVSWDDHSLANHIVIYIRKEITKTFSPYIL